jgi:single-stranded-DNA-specific exonuclease
LKFQLIGDNNLLNPLEAIFKNREVEDVETFLNLDESVIIDYKLLINIDKAVNCLINHIEKRNKIFVQCDSDCDGFSSSSILINYLNRVFPDVNIQWRLHEGKEHGLVLETIPNDVKLVIVPDAGSNQYKEHLTLKEKGIDIIVLDHHECEKVSENAIVVNNQLSPLYKNKNFSGAGITYKFCKAIDDKLKLNYADDYLDLVAIGNIGDMMDLREYETRYYVKKGLEQVNNPLLKALIEKQEYSMKGIVNITTVTFYVVPLINAAVRAANMSEKRDMMKSFLCSKEQVYYKRKDEHEPISVATARSLYNIRSRQNKLRDKGLESIEFEIENNSLLDNKVLFVNVTDSLDKNLTGLVANQISRKYKRPTVLYRKKGKGVIGGSGRGYENGHIKDFRQFLLGTDKFIFCEGHGNAFGIEINEQDLSDVQSIINAQLEGIDIAVDEYEVDLLLDSNELSSDLIFEIAKYNNEWGSKLTEPLLAFTNIPISKEDINLIGKNKNTIKMVHKGIEFVKFFTKEEIYNTLFSEGETFYINIIGKCSLNEWEGQVTPQILITDFEIVDTIYF